MKVPKKIKELPHKQEPFYGEDVMVLKEVEAFYLLKDKLNEIIDYLSQQDKGEE